MEKEATVGARRLAGLFDVGTFVETGAYVKRGNGELTGVVCGYGAIDGKLTYAFMQDSDRQKGAIDAPQAEKIAALYGMAIKNGAPVVGIFDSNGAVICDGASAMSAYGKLLACVSAASGVIPQIAVVTGVCAGMAATLASMFDIMVTVRDQSSLYVNSPFLLGKEVGTAEYVAQIGLSSIVAESEQDAFARAAELISWLPSNNEEGVVALECMDEINRSVLVDGLKGKDLLGVLADAGRVIELGAEYAPEMQTCLARFGGVLCGVVANNPEVDGGRLRADSAKKAAKMISFCDSFLIPVLTLTDSVGVCCAATEESAPLAAQLGKLAMAYATAETAKITVTVGKAYGAAFTLMGSKALGADMALALPGAEISVMDPSAAVAFLWNDRVTESVSRASLEEEWRTTQATPERAAADGSLDDVIDPAELRQRICAAVYMLMNKSGAAPVRKHCNLPL